MATIAYGEPRFTNGIDVVVELDPTKVADFCKSFPGPEFLCFEPAVIEAVRTRFQFNILQPATGLKIDVILATDSEFDRSRFQRGVRNFYGPGSEAWFASPEDVIVKKLQYYREGGSDKHIRDILGVLKVRGERVDRAYITEWVDRLGLVDPWTQVLNRESL